MLSECPNPTLTKDPRSEEKESPYLFQTSDPFPSVILTYSLKHKEKSNSNNNINNNYYYYKVTLNRWYIMFPNSQEKKQKIVMSRYHGSKISRSQKSFLDGRIMSLKCSSY